MNPPDDNQTGSKRQPFMSAKRRAAAGDDNILARLERDARRGRPGMRWKRSWIVWSSVASLVIIGLIGYLASLTRENIERYAPKAAADIKIAPDPYVPPAAGVATGFAPLPAASTPSKQPSAVGMRSDRTVLKTDAAAQPPLVTLKPNATPAKPAALPPPRIAAARPVTGKAVAPRPPAIAPRKTMAATAARPRKPAPMPAAAPEPADDSDVALLSAILLQTSRHADERAQLEAARCGAGKKCAPAPDPLPSSKATD